MKKIVLLFSFIIFTLGCKEAQPEDQDYWANDIPEPVATKMSTAGADEPDIVRFLNVQNAVAPSLSPDGKWVAYRTRLTGQYQLWVTRTDQLSAPRQLTYGNSVTFHRWSPGNNGIVYGTDMEGNEKEGFYLISSDGLQEKELLPPSNAFRFFGDFNEEGTQFTYSTTGRNDKDFDIHVYDLQSGSDEKVYNGKLGYYPISFSPDGKYIVISESMGEDANNLFLLKVSDATLSQINTPDDLSYFGNVQWSSDGNSFYMRTNSNREYIGIARYSIADASFEYVVEESNDIDQIVLADDSELHFVSNIDGFAQHFTLDLLNKEKNEVNVWPAGRIGLDHSKDGNIMVAYVTGPQIPGDLWSWVPGSQTATRITNSSNAGIDLEKMVLPEAHSFAARDGLTLHGLLYAPEGSDPSTPLVLMVHGGPTSQARPEFDALTQYLIGKGYAVFDLNYRGSTGYGKSFARANNLRKRADELYDLEDAVKYLVEKGITNGENTAVMGGSYGGYLTMAAMTRLPDVFNCGVAFVGVSNWVSALEGASPSLKASDRLEYGDIDNEEDRAFFEEMSPINYIDQVRSPVMVLHGANDPRDPVSESDRFVRGIRENGGEVEYLRFPDEGHGIRKMENRITAYVRVAEFLEKNLQSKTIAKD